MKPLYIIRKEAKCLKAAAFFLETLFLSLDIAGVFVTQIILSKNDEYLKIYYFCSKSNFFVVQKTLKKNLVPILNHLLANVSFKKVPKICFIFDRNYEKVLKTQNIIDNLS
ncbi:hypothetical protein JTY60_00625 [symbiont of Argiope bruennichi]|uniref:hypothetical protein n=1 Tax=symbiont of Argiope bruennichi TaxID=2810479 RepID=UPI003DA6518D